MSLDAGGTFIVTMGDGEPTATAQDGPSTRSVLVGLRSSAITIHTARPTHASPRNLWAGTVSTLELLTDRVCVQVDATPPGFLDSPPPPWPTSPYDPAPQCGS